MSELVDFGEGTLTLGPLVELKWRNGRTQRLGADYLRSKCFCQICRVAPIPLETSMFPGVTVNQVDLVGAYAVQFYFSDGHKHGVYSFDMLEKLPDQAP